MPAKHAPQSAGRVVLIVDDDPKVLRMTSQILATAGYHPLEATTPAEALGLAAQIKIDVFLVDAILPAMSGPDLADELSQLQREAKTVFMSGLDPIAVWLAFGEPCQVLRKPFTREELICKIEKPTEATNSVPVDRVQRRDSGEAIWGG